MIWYVIRELDVYGWFVGGIFCWFFIWCSSFVLIWYVIYYDGFILKMFVCVLGVVFYVCLVLGVKEEEDGR